MVVVSVQLEAIDAYDSGTFMLEDEITVTCPFLDLSGTYPVKRIERDLSDPDLVRLDLSVRRTESWELDEGLRRMVKDLSSA
jgi:hypothetical protein